MREVEVIDMNDDNVAYRKPAQQSNILNNNAAFGPESGNDGELNNLMQTGTVDSKFIACIFVALSKYCVTLTNGQLDYRIQILGGR